MNVTDTQNEKPLPEPAATATLQTLLDVSPMATVTLDLTGRVMRWNAAAERLFGWTSDEVVDGLDAFACAEAQWIREQCAQVLKIGRQIRVQTERPRRDGSLVQVTVSAAVTYDAGRDPQGFVVLYGEDRPGHAPRNNGLSQLANGIALEIKSPTQYLSDNLRFLSDSHVQIAKILNGVERLRTAQANGADPAVIWGEVAEICAAAESADLDYLLAEIPLAILQSVRGVQLVAQIVTAMKEFSPKQRAARVAVDLNKAVETTLVVSNNETRYVADTVTDLAPDLPPVWCLPGPINQVLVTLLVNAARAIADAPKSESGIGLITVSTRKIDSWVEIEVADTGNGIPPALQAHIFDAVSPADGAGPEKRQGLALAYATIIHQHHGRIWCETEVGKGTSFFVRLPIREPKS